MPPKVVNPQLHAYGLNEVFTCNGPNLFCGKLHSDQKKKTKNENTTSFYEE